MLQKQQKIMLKYYLIKLFHITHFNARKRCGGRTVKWKKYKIPKIPAAI
jgi:hypothetical protein